MQPMLRKIAAKSLEEYAMTDAYNNLIKNKQK